MSIRNTDSKVVAAGLRAKNTQLMLIQSLRQITTRIGVSSKDLYGAEYEYDPRVIGNSDLIPYIGPPELINTKLFNSQNLHDFIHATPAQLSILEPLLRFFMLDAEGNQEEVFFSDYVTTDKILKLASLRRSRSVEQALKPRSEVGSNVGIKSFSWDYNNKHEGDRIIDANLVLYFGNLTELVNVNYLQFLFTNGKKTPKASALDKKEGSGQSNSIERRLQDIDTEIYARLQALKFGTAPADYKDKVKENFRTLKVVVGWSVPSGMRSSLISLFAGDAHKLDNFLAGVKATQRLITLNMYNYSVDFQQEGPTTLSIDYRGSTDNYWLSDSSDVLSIHNAASATNKIEKAVPVTGIEINDMLAEGYIFKQFKNTLHQTDFGIVGNVFFDDRNIRLNVEGVQAELDVITLHMKKIALQKETHSNTIQNSPVSQYDEFKGRLDAVGTLYRRLKEVLRQDRYSAFLNHIMQQENLFVANAYYDEGSLEAERIKEGGALGRVHLRFVGGLTDEDLSNIAKRNKEAASAAQTDQEDPGGKKASEKRASIVDPSNREKKYESNTRMLPIFYMRFGDIIRSAMIVADMREDINIVLGSFAPQLLKIPGYAPTSQTSPNEYPTLYDIPISVDYFLQWFVDNIINKNIDQYPFRRFFDDAISKLLSPVLNFIQTDLDARLTFDYSIINTYLPLPSKILTAADLPDIQKNQSQQDLIMPPQPDMDRPPLSPASYYILFARQTQVNRHRSGNILVDEEDGVYHFVLGSDRGIALRFNFSEQDVPQYKAMQIETANIGANAQALILPQNVEIEMFGNTILKNGDLIYVDSRAALGTFANEVLAIGGYYRIYKSSHVIDQRGYLTRVSCIFERRTSP